MMDMLQDIFSWAFIAVGGFFLVVDVPFKVTGELLKECVEHHSVIFCPIYFFCLNEAAGAYQIRLAFSNLSPAKIEQGIESLSAFIKKKLSRGKK